MPKMQAHMTHRSRTAPYQTFPDIPSTQFTQDFPSTTNNERVVTGWSSEDDERLMQLRIKGWNWQPIAENFPSKTANACRKRHERLMDKKKAESWDDGHKIEELAGAYLDFREQMWKVLADVLGEKWDIVEKKCMEKGIKTLMTDGRAARRHKPAKQATPPNQHRSGSEFEDPALCLLMPHSPEITNNVPAPLLSNLHLSAYSYPNTLPSQKQASISSNESLLHTGMQAPAMSMAPSNPMHSYNYSSAQQQRYNTAQPISTSCMSAGFNVPPNHYTAYSESLNHPPSNRNYESISASRLSPHTIPALLPPSSLPAASRSQSSISPIY